MKNLMAGVALAGLLVATTTPLSADLTITARTTGKGIGQVSEGQSLTYLKGLKMRVDGKVLGNDTTTIFDVGAQTMTSIDHKKKEATTYQMSQFAEQLQKVPDSDVKVDLTATPRTREILGRACTEHTMTVTVGFSPIPDQKINIVLRGPVWVAKDAPGHEDFAAFYKAAAEKGFIFSDPRLVKSQPGHAKGLSAMYQSMAGAGLTYGSDISITFEGAGPMAGMLNKMGSSSMTTEVTAVATDPLADDLFAVPPGYTVKTGK